MKQLFFLICLCLAVVSTGKAQTSFITDSCLQQLVDSALKNNTDIRTAQLNLIKAEAVMRGAKLAYLPSFAFSPTSTLSKAQGYPLQKTYSLPVTMEWEFNFGGRQKYEKQMAKAGYKEAAHLLDYAKIQLVAEVANAYYTLVMLDQQLVITKKCVMNQETTLATMRSFKEVGKATDLAINEIEASYLNTQTSMVELEAQVKKTELAILQLLNLQSGNVPRSGWNEVKSFGTSADTSVSLEQLSSRPDVKAAEQQLAMAFGCEDMANSAFYPTLRITGDAGWTNNIGEIIDPARLLLQLIGSLTQPVFSRGTLKHQKSVAVTQRKQAEVAFEKALLVAGNEVKGALVEKKSLQQKLPLRERQVEVSRLAFENCQLLQTYSQSVSYIDVLMAQNTYLTAQLQQTADWLLLQQAIINLYKAICPKL